VLALQIQTDGVELVRSSGRIEGATVGELAFARGSAQGLGKPGVRSRVDHDAPLHWRRGSTLPVEKMRNCTLTPLFRFSALRDWVFKPSTQNNVRHGYGLRLNCADIAAIAARCVGDARQIDHAQEAALVGERPGTVASIERGAAKNWRVGRGLPVVVLQCAEQRIAGDVRRLRDKDTVVVVAQIEALRLEHRCGAVESFGGHIDGHIAGNNGVAKRCGGG